jgi:hypothetical protein
MVNSITIYYSLRLIDINRLRLLFRDSGMSSMDLDREVFPLKADLGLRSCLNRRGRTVYNEGKPVDPWTLIKPFRRRSLTTTSGKDGGLLIS